MITTAQKRDDLKANFLSAVSSGLERTAMRRCSRWAEKCRVMGQPYPGYWSFEMFPWLREMHDTNAPLCIGQKSAQAGYTESMLNRSLYTIDILGVSVMYILPAKTPDATDFSASRFDAALELSEYLNNLFSDTKNIGHKRAGGANLYIRGSRSRAGLKSVPAGFLVFDEVDEMVQENIPLALERQSGQKVKQTWMLSTPTIEDFGINSRFKDTTMESFFFACPHCGKRIRFVFPDCLEITADDPRDPKIKDSFYKCSVCNTPITQEQKAAALAESGKWVPEHSDRVARGFHVNQMYSSTVEPWRLATSYLLSQTNPADEQEFFNSKLGLPHIVEGARITDTQIENCTRNFMNGCPASPSKIITIGIDVGSFLHYCVVEWDFIENYGPDINMNCKGRLLEANKCLHFPDLEAVIQKYRPHMTVIDANPERRKAFELAQKFWGYVKLCFYGNNVTGKTINVGSDDLESTVTVDRTSWLDMTFSRFHNETIIVPKDVSMEFKNNIKAPARIYEKDKNDNPTGKYVNDKPDHYAHALNYSEIALKLAVTANRNINIKSPV